MVFRKCRHIFLVCCLFTTNVFAAVQVITPYHGSIQYSFTELARTRLSKIYNISMPLYGEVSRIELQPGDPIKKGQIVAELDEIPWSSPFYESQGRLESLKAQYKYQSKELIRRQKLGKKDFVSRRSIDQTQSQKDDISGKIVEEKAKLKMAGYHLDRTIIRSPIDGVVLKRKTEGGKWIIMGDTLLEVGNFKDLEVICDVLSQDAQRLHVGDPVIYTSVGTHVVLRGKVKRIEPQGFTKKSSLGVDEQRVNILSTIENAESANLGTEYRLQAKFLVGNEDKSALLIPRFSVLQDNQGHYYVFKVINKKLQKQFVKVGITTDSKISINEGLTTQDEIIAQPTAEMHSGMSIKV